MTASPASSITEVLDPVLSAEPARVCVIGTTRSLRYQDLDAAADAAAAALAGLGVGPGDRVAVCLPNDVDIVVAFHGVMRLGAVWVGLNRALVAPEKETLLAAATPTVVLADPATAATLSGRWRTVPVDPDDPGTGWLAAIAASTGAPRRPAPDRDLPAGIAFTSGTTGTPKGVVHSQRNLLLPAVSLVASRHYDSTLRKGDCLPLTILNLQVLTSLVTASAGGCCVLTDRRDARGVAEWLGAQAVTVWNGVPALLHSMIHDPGLDPSLLGSLVEAWTGGGPCPDELFVAFQARFGVPLRQTYGLTEAPTVVTIEPVDAGHHRGSSGVALPHLDVQVCDPAGRALPAGTAGRISVRAAHTAGPLPAWTPMLGYWNQGRVEPVATDELRTSDIGVLDEAGRLFVQARMDLVIIRGGANVYPAEVERILDAAPGVVASAVFGVPDERLGQRVEACVEVDPATWPGTAAVDAVVRESLARYKVPERYHQVTLLPRNSMGKVDRSKLAGLVDPSRD